MTDDHSEVHMDPVEDGLPTSDRLEWLFIGGMVAIGLWQMSHAQYTDAIESVLFAVLLYLLMRTRRTYWMIGYKAALQSVSESLEHRKEKEE